MGRQGKATAIGTYTFDTRCVLNYKLCSFCSRVVEIAHYSVGPRKRYVPSLPLFFGMIAEKLRGFRTISIALVEVVSSSVGRVVNSAWMFLPPSFESGNTDFCAWQHTKRLAKFAFQTTEAEYPPSVECANSVMHR